MIDCSTDIINDLRSFFENTTKLDIPIEDKISSLSLYVLAFSHGYAIGLRRIGLKPEQECTLILFINSLTAEYNMKKITAKEMWSRLSNLINVL